MSFRKNQNAHDLWKSIVEKNRDLLSPVPLAAIASEAAFRNYLTRSVHRDVQFSPSVCELSKAAVDDLWTFIVHKTEFDMDILYFDDFNEAFRKTRQSPSPGEAAPAHRKGRRAVGK